ncbi:SDR family NAD(P)-dependent oxidoreductase, partial [Streptomyces sp. URMC 123]|uniref:SDR family NAD(P)-dependent oxidoreductase n=1 Tax=Streptomyces sp. URMC 123 TaxID=3423403 RepID=UPI003F1ABB92
PAPRAPVVAGALPVTVSAPSPTALAELAGRMSLRLRQAGPGEFYDLAHTSTRRRGRHRHRATVLADSAPRAADALDRLFAGEPAAGALAAAADRGGVAYAFCGNGSQWPGMAADLLAARPDFRAAVAEADAALADHLGWSVVAELTRPTPERWSRADVAQPLLFAVQLGLCALLAARGVRPALVLGHSVGEVAAAHVAGALTLEQAALVVAERGRAQAATAGSGRMAAVGLPEQRAREALAGFGDALEVAGVNSDRDVTVAGEAKALAALGAELTAQGVFFRDLGLDYAYHTRAMDPVAGTLCAALSGLVPSPARLPLVSTVTGAPLAGEKVTGDYWWRNVREPIRFADAAAHAGRAAGIVVEIGPHPVLAPYLRRLDTVHVPTLRREAAGPLAMDACLAALVAAGAELDWSVPFPSPARVADLPAHPWQRRRHWQGGPADWYRSSGTGRIEHPLLGERLPGPHPVWEATVEPQLVPWLGDHLVDGTVVMPAAAFAEMALAAGRRALDAPVEVRHLEISRPLAVAWPDPGGTRLRTAVLPDSGVVTIATGEGRGGTSHPVVNAQVRSLLGPPPAPMDPRAVRERCPHTLDGAAHYEECRRLGLGYGPHFRLLRSLRTGDGEALATYRRDAPGGIGTWEAYPPLLDAAFQAGAPLLRSRNTGEDAHLPCGLGGLRVWRAPAPSGFVHVRARKAIGPEVLWDITITDDDGAVVAEIDRLRLRRAPRGRTPLSVRRTVLRAAPRPGPGDRGPVLPAPAELLARVADRITELNTAWRESGLHRASRALADAAAGCWTTVVAGFLTDPAAPFTLTDLVDAGLRPQHRRLLKVVLSNLRSYGLARRRPDSRWELTAVPAGDGADLRALLMEQPASGPEGLLVARQLLRMPDLLRGTVDPVQTLSSERGHYQHFYDVGPRSRYTNLLARTVLEEIVRRWPADRPLRVLEIGAGTGGLTAAVLPVLPADRTRYTFSDISPTFLTPAEHRFRRHDFLAYRTLDLDADAEGQGFGDGEFDVVLAANALHAASDLAGALRRVNRLLVPGGVLLAVESHDTAQLGTVFGTLDSFWHRGDPVLRPESVLLDRSRWSGLLEECGFGAVARAEADPAPDRVDCSLFVAAAGDRAVAPPALPDPLPGTTWTVAAEGPAEEPFARRLVKLLGDATVTSLDRLAALDFAGVREAAVVLVLAAPEEEPGRVVARTTRRMAALRALATARTRLPRSVRTRVWLVTRPTGLQPAPERPAHPADAPVWGAARTLANEHPDLRVHRVGLDRGDDPGTDVHRLAQELLDPGDEDEIVLTRGGRFVPRETECPAHEPPATGTADSYALTVRDPGRSYRLVWREQPARRPGPGEIALEVRAAALNYRDTLQANGLLPLEAVEDTYTEHGLGMECAGVVTAVGPGVTAWSPGDRVFGLVPACLASRAVVPHEVMWPIPDGMSFDEAVTLPVVFTTVHHGLGHLARLAPGETVLVHGGAGGVGLAVLQYARLTGAKVVATAGTEAKRDVLTALGADHVLDSRTLDFVPRVRHLTHGRGVDVVVNSLSGEAGRRSLELLRPGGRFVELGKRDMLENKPLPLRPFLHNLSYFAVDLNQLARDHRTMRRLLAETGERIRAGAYRPLPHVAYPAARVDEAFALLQHSRHIGKVVISFAPWNEPVPVRPAPAPPKPLDPDGTYLVTGGLGGFGAATADWLADHGARHLALVSRRGPDAPEAPAVLRRLARRGVTATPYAADVADEAALRRVLDAVAATGHPLRGVVHCAMWLDDAPLTDLTDERVVPVLAAKAAGAALLHRLTAGHDLDLFLLWSSTNACVGNVHQAPYTAGNGYLEALARARRHAGLPAAAIAWGAISETGYVARNNLQDSLAATGLEPVAPDALLPVAARLLADGAEVAGIARMDWARYRRVMPDPPAPRFSRLFPARTDAPGGDREELIGRLAAMARDDAVRTITEA